MVAPRDVSPFLQTLRVLLLGRKHKNPLRFADGIAARTQPPPELPDGPFSKLSKNSYCGRDARREALPPHLLINNVNKQKTISAGQTKGSETGSNVTIKTPLPGTTYIWRKSPESL